MKKLLFASAAIAFPLYAHAEDQFCYNRNTGVLIHQGLCAEDELHPPIRTPQVGCDVNGAFAHWGNCTVSDRAPNATRIYNTNPPPYEPPLEAHRSVARTEFKMTCVPANGHVPYEVEYNYRERVGLITSARGVSRKYFVNCDVKDSGTTFFVAMAAPGQERTLYAAFNYLGTQSTLRVVEGASDKRDKCVFAGE